MQSQRKTRIVAKREDYSENAPRIVDEEIGVVEGVIGEGIDFDADLLPHRDMGEVGFFQIGIDPRLGDIDHREHRRARHDEAAEQVL